jgi:hypothetical protein
MKAVQKIGRLLKWDGPILVLDSEVACVNAERNSPNPNAPEGPRAALTFGPRTKCGEDPASKYADDCRY